MSTTPTERRLAITPGEAHIMDQHEAGTHLKGFKVIVADGAPSAYVDANHAPLYCDANNTYNACGLTPSELMAKWKEATDLLSDLHEYGMQQAIYGRAFPEDIMQPLYRILSNLPQ